MPGTGPCKVTTEKGLQRQPTAAKLPKKEFLHVLRTSGVPEETIKATDEQLQDPIDLERDGVFLVTHGLDRPAHEPNGRQPVSAPAVRGMRAGPLASRGGRKRTRNQLAPPA